MFFRRICDSSQLAGSGVAFTVNGCHGREANTHCQKFGGTEASIFYEACIFVFSCFRCTYICNVQQGCWGYAVLQLLLHGGKYHHPSEYILLVLVVVGTLYKHCVWTPVQIAMRIWNRTAERVWSSRAQGRGARSCCTAVTARFECLHIHGCLASVRRQQKRLLAHDVTMILLRPGIMSYGDAEATNAVRFDCAPRLILGRWNLGLGKL